MGFPKWLFAIQNRGFDLSIIVRFQSDTSMVFPFAKWNELKYIWLESKLHKAK